MTDRVPFSNSIGLAQSHLAERELAAFISAVTKLFGPEQARTSTEDWLDEAELINGLARRNGEDWRSVTIAAPARLANRIDTRHYRQKSSTAQT